MKRTNTDLLTNRDNSRCDHLSMCNSLFVKLLCLCLVFVILPLNTGCTSKGNAVDEPRPANRYERTNAKYHKVRKGDTLYTISFKAGVDFRTLAAWNGLRKPYTIYPGQTLRLVPPVSKTGRSGKKSYASSEKKNSYPPASTASTKKSSAPSTTKTKAGSSAAATSSGLNWVWPATGKVVSQYSSKDAARDGIKIAGRENQKVLAAEAGSVVYVGSGLVGYGRLIIIKHDNKYLSAYGLNNRLLVKEGELVKRKQQIAQMGADNSGKPMLHFEIRRFGKPVNPILYLPK